MRCRAVGLCLLAVAFGCAPTEREPFSYYEERIAPVLDVGCQRQTTGCHVDDGNGFALGNLDLSSYDTLAHRDDVLDAYGPYPVGLLLLKAGDPVEVQVETVDPPDPSQPDRRYVNITTDIRHGGGQGAIAQGSADYSLLKQWIDGGHTRAGVPAPVVSQSIGGCVSGAAALPGVDLDSDPEDAPSFASFVDRVQPVLVERCAGSSCHGNRNADLYLSCGNNAVERRWNYQIATRHLASVAASSELLRRPLALTAGGVFHEGGDVFSDTEDAGYKLILKWAEDLAKRRPELLRFETEDDGLRFFANRVQPILVRKGCMFLGCHSPAMFHDLRLRGGSRGDFSEVATRKNHEMSRLMLALESSDPNNSRLIAKNLCPSENGGQGVKHRGGALLEDFGGCADRDTQASVTQCAGVDADAGDLNQVPAYCVLARWHALERELAIARSELTDDAGPRGVVWVARPEGIGAPTEFHAYRPGADLLWADTTSTAADGSLTLGAPRSLLGECSLPADVDVRAPAVSWDGQRIAFAVRTAEDAPLRLYAMRADGTECAPIAGIAPAADQEDGILLHDFDPAYAPDGRLVFASTRGYLDGGVRYRGPTRTPAALAPNANLYVFDSTTASVRQLTYLLDQELAPSFMADGRLIFSAEKRAEGFHQLAGRRQNLDGGDYHPLFAQRPSIGFESATEIVELANRNLALTAAPLSALDGGGTIVVINRSIGPDQDDRDPGDKAYVHSLSTPLPGAFGGGSGVFRSPAPLPSGRLIASCDLMASSLDAAPPHYGLCELDPTGARAPIELYSEVGRVALEAVAIYARAPVVPFQSRTDEPNGSTRVEPDREDAVVHYADVRVLGTLLFANTREGRALDSRVAGLRLYEVEPPPNSATGFDELGDDVLEDDYGRFYQSLRSLGGAHLRDDGSARVRVPGGMPLSLALTDKDGDILSLPEGAPLSGPMRQREAMQFYPGERTNQGFPRRLFDGMCAGCHGALSGRELDVHTAVDVLTSASHTLAADAPVDLR